MLKKFFDSLKQIGRKNTVLLKILFSYLLISVVLTSSLSFLLIKTYTAKQINEVKRITHNMVLQSYNTADSIFFNTFSFLYSIYQSDTDIVNGLYGTTFDWVDKYNIMEKLKRILNLNKMIYSVYICNAEVRLVFSATSDGYTFIDRWESFYDKDALELINDVKERYRCLFIARATKYKIFNTTFSQNFITLLFYMPEKGISDSAFIINFKQADIQKTLTSGKIDDQFQVFIIDKEGYVISHNDERMIGKSMGEEKFIKRIITSSTKAGDFVGEYNSKKIFVSYVRSENLGWTIVGVGEYNRLLNVSTIAKKQMILITIVFLLVGIFIAFLFTQKMYLPIGRLVNEIRQKKVASVSEMDEYTFLNFAFNNLIDNLRKLTRDVDIMVSAKKKEIILRLLNGEYVSTNEGKVKQLMKQYEIKLANSSSFAVIIIALDNFKNLCMMYRAKDISLFKFSILNVAEETLSERYVTESVENGLNYVSIIVGNDKHGRELDMNELVEYANKVKNNMNKFLNLSVTVTVGNIVHSINLINNSYERAMNLLSYRLLKGFNQVISVFDTVNEDSKREYPYDIENQIIKAIKSKCPSKIEEAVNMFFDYISNFTPDDVFQSIIQLSIMLNRTFNVSSLVSKEVKVTSLYNFKSLFTQIQEYETLEEIKKLMLTISTELAKTFENETLVKKKEVAQQVKEYIDENYSRPDITIYTLADKVNLSPNYVRLIFKEIYNISPSDYLLEVRMNKAKELLIQTDYTVKKIAELVGFSDNRYFYITFKRYTGKTAEEFRKEHRQKDLV